MGTTTAAVTFVAMLLAQAFVTMNLNPSQLAVGVSAGTLLFWNTLVLLICKPSLAYSISMVDVFRALDDETRRLVLDELSVRDGQTLFEICSVLTMRHGLSITRQAISQHLGVLESAGLVVTERRGRSKFHYFNPEPLAEITGRWPTRKRTEQ